MVLPGGFAYGDYLRAGALAALSPVMGAVRRHAEAGGLVLGICNGFQVLLRPASSPAPCGATRTSASSARTSICRSSGPTSPSPGSCGEGQVLRLPIAHAEGNYEDSPERLDALEANGQVVFRYVHAGGRAGRRRRAVEPERRGARHRRHLQPAAATSSA